MCSDVRLVLGSRLYAATPMTGAQSTGPETCPAWRMRCKAAIDTSRQPATAVVFPSGRGFHGDILGFAPPLVTTKAEVDEIIAITESAVRSVMDELVRSGEKI